MTNTETEKLSHFTELSSEAVKLQLALSRPTLGRVPFKVKATSLNQSHYELGEKAH